MQYPLSIGLALGSRRSAAERRRSPPCLSAHRSRGRFNLRSVYCDLRRKQASAALNQRRSSNRGAPRCGGGLRAGSTGEHEHTAAGFYPSVAFFPSRTQDPRAKRRPVRDTRFVRAVQRRSQRAPRRMRPGICRHWIVEADFLFRQRGVQAALGRRTRGLGCHDCYDSSRDPERSWSVHPIGRKRISFCCASIPYPALPGGIPARRMTR
jgi:hypothetical protein